MKTLTLPSKGAYTSSVSLDELQYIRSLDELTSRKMSILFDAVKALGLPLDIEKEKTAKFKKLGVTHFRDTEDWYYNDGTQTGIHIATFVFTTETKRTGSGSKLKISQVLSYTLSLIHI